MVPVSTSHRIIKRGAELQSLTNAQLTSHEETIAKPLTIDRIVVGKDIDDTIDAPVPLRCVIVLTCSNGNEAIEERSLSSIPLRTTKPTPCYRMKKLVASILIVWCYRLVPEEAIN